MNCKYSQIAFLLPIKVKMQLGSSSNELNPFINKGKWNKKSDWPMLSKKKNTKTFYCANCL